jgi:hypothetical protein
MMFVPSLLQIKLIIAATVYVGSMWTVGHWTTKIERSAWEKKEAKRKADAFESFKRTEKFSYESGTRYEAKRSILQTKLTTPDRKLDEIIQTPAGDVVLPGALGMRLNFLGTEAGKATGELDSTLPADTSISDDGRSTTSVETDTRS